MAKVKIKAGDTVLVRAGRTRASKALCSRSTRDPPGARRRRQPGGPPLKVTAGQGGSRAGGLITKESPIDISNVMLVDDDGTATRTGSRIDQAEVAQRRHHAGDHRRVRVSRRTGKGRVMTTTMDSTTEVEVREMPRLKVKYLETIRRNCRPISSSTTSCRCPAWSRSWSTRGRRRRGARLEGHRRGRARLGDHHRPEAAGDAGAQVDRAVQVARGHAHRCALDAARRPDVEFLDRLVSVALPRIRDFRGLSPNQFDGRGNYTFGLTEQVVFPEIDQDSIDRSRGMDVTVVTTAVNDDQGRALLRARLPVQGEVSSGEESPDQQGEQQAEVQGARLHRCTVAADPTRSTASSVSAGYACVRWRTGASCPA